MESKTRAETKREQLMEFVEELKDKGFKVYGPTIVTTYCHFVKYDKIGYVEAGDHGFNFSTVHKPCRECGTGFGMERETHNPTAQMAHDCLVEYPSWASSADRQAVKKYKSWEDYASYPSNNWRSQVEL